MNNQTMIILIVAIIILICFSAVFSCADMVYGAVNHLRLKKAAEKGNKSAKLALKFAENYDTTISTILFSNNLVNIGASSISTLLGIYWFGEQNGPIYMSLILLVALLMFGEIIPKVIGRIYSYQLSILLAYPILFFKYLFFPIVWITSKIGSFVAIPFVRFHNQDKNEDQVSDEELQEMIDTIEEEGIIDEDQGDLLRSAIEFKETQAFEIMTPRIDIDFIDIDDEVTSYIKDEDMHIHSRIPVYEDTVDNIIGFVQSKVILKKMLANEKINLKDIILPIKFVPRSMLISDILEDMKHTKTHIVIVKDEYGGTEGLITMEDILEELVGDIFDENDEVELPCKKVGHNKYLIDGSMNIDDVFSMLDSTLDEETDYSTIGGWCIEQIGRFAVKGDKFSYKNFDFIVVEAEEFTVEKIRVINNQLEEEE